MSIHLANRISELSSAVERLRGVIGRQADEISELRTKIRRLEGVPESAAEFVVRYLKENGPTDGGVVIKAGMAEGHTKASLKTSISRVGKVDMSEYAQSGKRTWQL